MSDQPADFDCCGGCRFFYGTGDQAGREITTVCRRYPEHVIKIASSWCGEFSKAATLPPPAPETDGALRVRIQQVAGRNTVNQAKIETATGEALDELGSWYGVRRRGTGLAPNQPIPPLTEGYTVKGGHNEAPSQITERPDPPGPTNPQFTNAIAGEAAGRGVFRK